jgi:CRISPR-associated endoribonuclease Cas6
LLLSAVLTLSPSEPITLPVNLGRATHAWFLDAVRELDPELSEILHTPNQERPFTVSNLMGTGRSENGMVRLAPERTYTLRLTSYEPALTALIAEQYLPALPETIALGGQVLQLHGATADTAQQAWAGRVSYESLVQTYTLGTHLPQHVTLRFASPTVFKTQDAYLPVPLPKLVFDGLARRWNLYAPIRIQPEVGRYAEECMAISRYDLHTERVIFGEDDPWGATPGFVGTCSYVFRVKDRYWMGIIQMLAAFAMYAGVGRHTTMGWGQTRLVMS